MNKPLAIIGAGYLQLPLVRKANEMGLETHCFAWREGAVCEGVAHAFHPVSITQKEAILEECRRLGVAGITSIASDLAVPTVSYVASQLGLPGNDYRWAPAQTDKFLMREALSPLNGAGLQQSSLLPRYLVLEGDAGGLVPEALPPFPLIVKPTDRSGSRGVTKVSSMDELRDAVNRAFSESLSGRVIVEEYINGAEVSVESISHGSEHHVLQITDKVTTGEPYFVELAHHQPSALPMQVQEKIRRLVPMALEALHVSTGASHTELKITPGGELKIIEIGARMGGDFIGSDLVMLSTGYDFLRGVILCALGRWEQPRLSDTGCSGVHFLSEETPGVEQAIREAGGNPAVVRAEITDASLHPLRQSADRSGYLIYHSGNRIDL